MCPRIRRKRFALLLLILGHLCDLHWNSTKRLELNQLWVVQTLHQDGVLILENWDVGTIRNNCRLECNFSMNWWLPCSMAYVNFRVIHIIFTMAIHLVQVLRLRKLLQLLNQWLLQSLLQSLLQWQPMLHPSQQLTPSLVICLWTWDPLSLLLPLFSQQVCPSSWALNQQKQIVQLNMFDSHLGDREKWPLYSDGHYGEVHVEVLCYTCSIQMHNTINTYM